MMGCNIRVIAVIIMGRVNIPCACIYLLSASNCIENSAPGISALTNSEVRGVSSSLKPKIFKIFPLKYSMNMEGRESIVYVILPLFRYTPNK